jgi:ADP-ribose pyrophosphatase YjhB (NUDIX family)
VPRFCSGCGAHVGRPAPVACAACGKQHWLNAKPSAGALVVRDGRLLLTQRALDPWRGLWCAPSGFCDGEEHPIDAAVREAREEAAIDVRVTGYLGLWIDEYAPATPEGDDAEYVAVAYYHAVPTGDAGDFDHDEVSATRWFEADALPSELAPPVNGSRIYGAWRAAHAAGQTATPLRDRAG